MAVLGAIAVAACMVATVSFLGGGSSEVELESSTPSGPSAIQALASDSKLPSWLRTGPVKLRPLHELVREQELDRKMAQGRVSDKLMKEEHAQPATSPRELAMRSVHMLASKKQHTARVLQPVHVQAASANGRKQEATSSPQASKVTAGATAGSGIGGAQLNQQAAAEIKSDEAKLKAVDQGEKAAEAAARKAELHKLASIKSIADKTRMSIESDMHRLKEQPIRNEKAKLKAEMAKVEEQEQEKLAAIKKKLAQLSTKSSSATSQGTSAPAAASSTSKVEVSAAPAIAESAKATQTQQGLAVTAAQTGTGAAAAATASQVAVQSQGGVKHSCDDKNCDLGKEDSKWLAHKDTVDKYAALATKGSGKAREQALAHMQALEHQIQNDFKHVTSFATAQEYALGRPQK